MGKDNIDQLVKITNVLGTADLYAYLEKFKIKLDPNDFSPLVPKTKKEWSTFVTMENAALCSRDSIDLLSKMLVYDHTKRLSAAEAMNHPYFDSLKK